MGAQNIGKTGDIVVGVVIVGAPVGVLVLELDFPSQGQIPD